MKCPKCGYENKEDVLCCGLCYEVLKKTKTQAKASAPDMPKQTSETRPYKPMSIPKSFLAKTEPPSAKPQDNFAPGTARCELPVKNQNAFEPGAAGDGISKSRRGPASLGVKAKIEEPKLEEPKLEEPKLEEPKLEEPKLEEPKLEEPKLEEPKSETRSHKPMAIPKSFLAKTEPPPAKSQNRFALNTARRELQAKNQNALEPGAASADIAKSQRGPASLGPKPKIEEPKIEELEIEELEIEELGIEEPKIEEELEIEEVIFDDPLPAPEPKDIAAKSEPPAPLDASALKTGHGSATAPNSPLVEKKVMTAPAQNFVPKRAASTAPAKASAPSAQTLDLLPEDNTTQPAVDTYNPPCKNHFGRSSVGKCDQCHAYFCGDCLQEKDSAHYCKNCFRKRMVLDNKEFKDKCLELIVNPKKFFSEMPQEGSYADVLKFLGQSYHLLWGGMGVAILLLAMRYGLLAVLALIFGVAFSKSYLMGVYVGGMISIVLAAFLGGGLLYVVALALGSDKGYKPNFMIAANVYAVQIALFSPAVLLGGFLLVLFKSEGVLTLVVFLLYATYLYLSIGVLCYGMMRIHRLTLVKTVIVGVALVLFSLTVGYCKDYWLQKRMERTMGFNTSPSFNRSQAVRELNDDNFDQEVLAATTPVLVDFWASWCPPCRVMSPAVDKIAGEYRGRVKICKFDVDKGPNMPARYGITSIPTIIIFKNKEIVKQWSGAQREVDENKAVLRQALNEVLSQ
jgi:thioredoxin 1